MFANIAISWFEDKVIHCTEDAIFDLDASVFQSNNYPVHPFLSAVLKQVSFEVICGDQRLQSRGYINTQLLGDFIRLRIVKSFQESTASFPLDDIGTRKLSSRRTRRNLELLNHLPPRLQDQPLQSGSRGLWISWGRQRDCRNGFSGMLRGHYSKRAI